MAVKRRSPLLFLPVPFAGSGVGPIRQPAFARPLVPLSRWQLAQAISSGPRHSDVTSSSIFTHHAIRWPVWHGRHGHMAHNDNWKEQ